MARIHQSGFEMATTASLVEWNLAGTGQTIVSTAARTGGYGLRISGMTSATTCGVLYKFVTSTSPGPFFVRTYLNVQTPPSASNHIMSINAGSGTVGASPQVIITLESNSTLILRNAGGTQIGSASSALTAGTWYMVEMKIDTNPASGSRIAEARLNGTIFATSSSQSNFNTVAFSLGGNLSSEAQTTGEWWFDDVAVNDNTGAAQTSYPGAGKIIQLLPNAAGDANGFATQVGGTAGSANNYTRVNELPTDNNTSYNSSGTLNAEDLFNVTDSGIGSADTVNVVMVGFRIRNDVVDATTAIKAEVEKTSGGTIAQGSAVIVNQNSYVTNVTAAPHNYTLILYQDPDGSNWTQATLDTMQIGYKITAANVNKIQVTSAWATIDYLPATYVATNEATLLGVG